MKDGMNLMIPMLNFSIQKKFLMNHMGEKKAYYTKIFINMLKIINFYLYNYFKSGDMDTKKCLLWKKKLEMHTYYFMIELNHIKSNFLTIFIKKVF